MTDIAPELSPGVVNNHCPYDIDTIVELRDGELKEVGLELAPYRPAVLVLHEVTARHKTRALPRADEESR
jgi:hypothetical protein